MIDQQALLNLATSLLLDEWQDKLNGLVSHWNAKVAVLNKHGDVPQYPAIPPFPTVQEIAAKRDELARLLVPQPPQDKRINALIALVKEAPNFFHPCYDFDGAKLDWLERAEKIAK